MKITMVDTTPETIDEIIKRYLEEKKKDFPKELLDFLRQHGTIE